MKKKTSEILIYLIGAFLSILVSWYILDSLWLAIAYCIAVMLGIMFLLKQNKKNLEFYHNIDASYEFVNLMNEKVKDILEWIYCIVIAVVLALLVRYYVGTPTIVKQVSMYPTLVQDQRLWLNRWGRTTKKL